MTGKSSNCCRALSKVNRFWEALGDRLEGSARWDFPRPLYRASIMISVDSERMFGGKLFCFLESLWKYYFNRKLWWLTLNWAFEQKKLNPKVAWKPSANLFSLACGTSSFQSLAWKASWKSFFRFPSRKQETFILHSYRQFLSRFRIVHIIFCGVRRAFTSQVKEEKERETKKIKFSVQLFVFHRNLSFS